ncbi:hypothetical protein A33Q_1620 [Indibacter alkaliphilus LW1]|uniref:DUF2264 domain-containing protein n=1 Tax=Indibacter alkaliphilus (strain CCUG 57479 / KCTC 22604 / LW1) TaxID=1189612 RepID=S2E063_INDAL|nr:DUF2264 domain-containing protein [Indibacter alkaliphilus]EOZ97811.1 hypothetical protein A33Q_1620 [Indibacter alkaliphilus LW1]
MNRRTFLKASPAVLALPKIHAGQFNITQEAQKESVSRSYWLEMMLRICTPVLNNLAERNLKRKMPVETPSNVYGDRREFAHLEAFGRTLAGIGPWMALTDLPVNEKTIQQDILLKTALGIENATDPKSKDFMNWSSGTQPLVDAAFLVHGILRSKGRIWDSLSIKAKNQLIDALMELKVKIKPWYNNWLLFGAMIDAFLFEIGEQGDLMRMDFAIKKHQEWYLGDGWYGDGQEFHLDYYNGYVIQSMLVQVLETAKKVNPAYENDYNQAVKIMTRHAFQQERFISPEGTYPPLGRSIIYRIGAFQTLADAVLRNYLPDDFLGQVKGALSAVLYRQFEAEGTFDAEGWLKIGFCGHQPDMGDEYICTGSLYLCSTGFLPLGLPEKHLFWKNPAQEWSSKKAWSGKEIPKDKALKL